MPPRQVWLFKFGCWAAFGTAALHLFGHVVGPVAPNNDTERQLVELATTYRYLMPGGAERSMMDFLDGFSLMFSLFLATVGALGLVIAKRGRDDEVLIKTAARLLAGVSAVLVVISLTHFFIIPSMCLALMAVSFACASVTK